MAICQLPDGTALRCRKDYPASLAASKRDCCINAEEEEDIIKAIQQQRRRFTKKGQSIRFFQRDRRGAREQLTSERRRRCSELLHIQRAAEQVSQEASQDTALCIAISRPDSHTFSQLTEQAR